MLIAVTRAVSPSLPECELTHRPRDPIDVAKAVAEHAQYEAALRSLGATVVRASPAPTLPDSVFVEDTAIVLAEIAVITRPGAATRRPETESVAKVLGEYKPLARIEPPGTLDGGDVMRLGRTLYVGLSSRTNRSAIAQLEQLVAKWNYAIAPVPVTKCLHLKSAVTQIGEQRLLINSSLVPADAFRGMDVIHVAPAEPDAANALLIDGSVIYPTHYPATAERLHHAGVRIVSVPAAELAKAEGGVTCCSIVFER